MDIPETEKLDVNASSALADPRRRPAVSLLLPLSLFFSFAWPWRNVRWKTTTMVSFPPFFGRGSGREREKKNNLANFPSRTRALGQLLCETDVFPPPSSIQLLARDFKADTGSKMRLVLFIGLKSSSRAVYPIFQCHSRVDNLWSATFLSGRHRFSSHLFHKFGICSTKLQNSSPWSGETHRVRTVQF